MNNCPPILQCRKDSRQSCYSFGCLCKTDKSRTHSVKAHTNRTDSDLCVLPQQQWATFSAPLGSSPLRNHMTSCFKTKGRRAAAASTLTWIYSFYKYIFSFLSFLTENIQSLWWNTPKIMTTEFKGKKNKQNNNNTKIHNWHQLSLTSHFVSLCKTTVSPLNVLLSLLFRFHHFLWQRCWKTWFLEQSSCSMTT